MLLQRLNDFATSRNLLDNLAFRPKAVRWIITLDDAGNLVGQGPVETVGERNRGKEFDCPQTTRPKVAGGVAEFLADGITAVFGLDTSPEQPMSEKKRKDRDENNRRKYDDFWAQIEKAYKTTFSPALKSLLAFKPEAGQVPAFLRWGVGSNARANEISTWWVTTADGRKAKVGLSDNFSFRVEGTLLLEDGIHIRPYWQKQVTGDIEVAEESAERGICLITGEEDVPIARTHTPMVTGLPKPAKGTGAGIVGFESPSFQSYGFEKSYNASSSISASKSYLLALQYLSSRENHWLQIGPAWLCFWAVETEEASDLFSALLRKPTPLTVRKFMTSPWSGLQKMPPKSDQFISVALTAAGPRIIVKDWHQATLDEAVKNFQTWFSDLEIQSITQRKMEEDNTTAHLSIRRLARTLLRPDNQRRFDETKLKPNLMASLYGAALRGSAPSITLLPPMLRRLQANIAKEGTRALYDQSRFALLRLIVNRHHRNRKELNMEIPPELPARTDDPAYNSGRLLSVLNSLQRSAHDGRLQGASIAERYYSSASTNPNAAFSLLWRLHQHHLKKLRQKGEKGQKAAYRIRENITEICSRITPTMPGQPPQLPRIFMIVEQARFALGFYHQEAARAEAVRLWKEKQQAVGKPDSDEDIPEEDLFVNHPV